MDFELLRDILRKEFIGMEVNQYENGMNGTVRLAEHHLGNLEGGTSKRLGKSGVAMFHNGKKFGEINGQVPSTNDRKAIRLCNDKMEAERRMSEFGLRTTDSVLLEDHEYERAKLLIEKSTGPMVLKPYNLAAGKGITLGVDITNIAFAWNQAKDAYSETNKTFKVLLQPMLPGIETRMLIVEGKFDSAILRVPANVIGDGHHTIEELISIKNKAREDNPHLKRLPLNVDKAVKYNLERTGKDVDTIPESDEIVFLHASSNISLGGDSYEISHLINENMKIKAEKAVCAIPGISTAGVDIMFESFDEENPAILEINPGANLRMHHYPWKGEPKFSVFNLVERMLDKHLNPDVR
jgi:D-alanine-D-alanine ligase-like ATP-grasp enzyme